MILRFIAIHLWLHLSNLVGDEIYVLGTKHPELHMWFRIMSLLSSSSHPRLFYLILKILLVNPT